MNSITLGDPATQAGTPFTLLMPDTRGGTISIINESAYGLDFTIQNATFRVPADTKRDISIRGQISQQAAWRIANNTNAAVAPISDVVVECYGLDECPVSNIQPLMRQTNVGNTSPVSTNVSQVLNDGNTAPVLVVEGTPSGAVGSQLKWNNDGSGIFGGGLASVTNAGILTLPAGAVPVASIGAGNLPATTKVPVANLNAGALPSGVTLPVAQLTGTLPASQVGSGYPGADVSGAVASATSATSATTAASLSGSIGASQVNPGTFPTGEFDMKAPNVVGGEALILWSGNVTGGYGHVLMLKNGADNTCESILGIGDFTQSPFGFGTWLYDQKNSAAVFTGVSSERTVAKRGPLAQMTTNGGGNAGNRLWEGTTDPGGNAAEGDWWAPA